MIVTKHEAAVFISGYTQIMAVIHGPTPAGTKTAVLEMLARARMKYLADRSLLNAALHELNAQSVSIAPEVVSVVRSIEVKQWIYLKDTRVHSIFLDPADNAAYGVLGLTEGLRTILGNSGAVVETGLMRYGRRYVSDCLITNVVWLGPNYRNNFAQRFAEIKAQGGFRKSCEP